MRLILGHTCIVLCHVDHDKLYILGVDLVLCSHLNCYHEKKFEVLHLVYHFENVVCIGYEVQEHADFENFEKSS